MRRFLIAMVLILAGIMTTTAQNFFNLTADEVRVDTLLPRFSYSFPLPDNYADSLYTAEILYPDFIDMSPRDISCYHAITTDSLPALPEIEQRVVVERKHGHLEVSFVPLVYREEKYQILVSFMLNITAKPVPTMHRVQGVTSTEPAQRYAQNSVLAEGRWAKIRVSSSGVYQLTEQLIKQAGFSNLSRVRIYGYGGALQNEQLVPEELIATDDLKEVATYTVGGRRLFYARGAVSWSKKLPRAMAIRWLSIVPHSSILSTPRQPTTTRCMKWMAIRGSMADETSLRIVPSSTETANSIF